MITLNKALTLLSRLRYFDMLTLNEILRYDYTKKYPPANEAGGCMGQWDNLLSRADHQGRLLSATA